MEYKNFAISGNDIIIEQRIEYVVDIEKFTFTNSVGCEMTLNTKLYITEINGYWSVFVGADSYGYRESLSGYKISDTSLYKQIEISLFEYYNDRIFQDYILNNE